MKRSIQLGVFFCLSFMLCACGFHLRNKSQLPSQLYTLYYSPENPYDAVASELKDTLTSIGIKLVSSPSLAAYTLRLSKTKIRHSRANLNNVSQASSIQYSQSVNASLIRNKTHKTVVSSNFSASMSQYLNQNQIMTANTASLATQNLPHDLVTHIFIWLMTDNVQTALIGKTHAHQNK